MSRIRVRESATVICLRQSPRGSVSPTSSPARLFRSDLGSSLIAPIDDLFVASSQPGSPTSALGEGGAGRCIELYSNWEVLMGQREAINWLRSTREERKPMRYAAEFVFAGGGIDEGENASQAAERELTEEFMLAPRAVTENGEALSGEKGASKERARFSLRPFLLKQTFPVGREVKVSYIMRNFIACSFKRPDSAADASDDVDERKEENAWLDSFDVEETNLKLRRKREAFKRLLESGEFWAMSHAQKEEVSPEVHQVEWVPLQEAIFRCFSSIGAKAPMINEYQRRTFAEHKIGKRDPLFITGLTLLHLELFLTPQALLQWTELIDSDFSNLLGKEQWLWDGTALGKVQQAISKRSKPSSLGALLASRQRVVGAQKPEDASHASKKRKTDTAIVPISVSSLMEKLYPASSSAL